METVLWDELFSDEQWDIEARSDIELEISRDRLSKDAVRRCSADPDKWSRVIPHPDVGQAVPRTEASLTLKLSNIEEKSRRSLRGSGARVIGDKIRRIHVHHKRTEKTSEVTIRNSDLAKFGTKAETNWLASLR